MLCKIEGCGRIVQARRMCHMHYLRYRRNGNPGLPGPLCEHHGMSNKRIYTIWLGMIARCHNPNNPKRKYYGGRDILVCLAWRNSFTAFLNDMGQPSSERHQIDRIDNDGGYDKSNCHWVLPAENRRNRPDVKLNIEKVKQILQMNIRGMSNRKIGKIFGVSKTTVCRILQNKIWREDS